MRSNPAHSASQVPLSAVFKEVLATSDGYGSSRSLRSPCMHVRATSARTQCVRSRGRGNTRPRRCRAGCSPRWSHPLVPVLPAQGLQDAQELPARGVVPTRHGQCSDEISGGKNTRHLLLSMRNLLLVCALRLHCNDVHSVCRLKLAL